MQFRRERLVEQTRLIMASGRWITIPALAIELDCSECGASARIRDQRKSRFGGHKIVKRLRSGGLYEYKMLSEKEAKNEQ